MAKPTRSTRGSSHDMTTRSRSRSQSAAPSVSAPRPQGIRKKRPARKAPKLSPIKDAVESPVRPTTARKAPKLSLVKDVVESPAASPSHEVIYPSIEQEYHTPMLPTTPVIRNGAVHTVDDSLFSLFGPSPTMLQANNEESPIVVESDKEATPPMQEFREEPTPEDRETRTESTPTVDGSHQSASPAPFESTDKAEETIVAAIANGYTHTGLPVLKDPNDPKKTVPYSAKLLTQTYTEYYKKSCWDLCDLTVDTWIRAMHKRRDDEEEGQRVYEHSPTGYDLRMNQVGATPPEPMWRPNKVIKKRKREAEKDYAEAVAEGRGHEVKRQKKVHMNMKTAPPFYPLKDLDPALEPNVTDVNLKLINEIYNKTNKDCGARLLWADSMALAGAQTDTLLRKKEWKEEGAVHKDLLTDVMSTSLRLCRRNLTLKVEETTEGEWCNRYHEHTKHGLSCYRQRASEERMKGVVRTPSPEAQEEVVDDEEEVESVTSDEDEDEPPRTNQMKAVAQADEVDQDVEDSYAWLHEEMLAGLAEDN